MSRGVIVALFSLLLFTGCEGNGHDESALGQDQSGSAEEHAGLALSADEEVGPSEKALTDRSPPEGPQGFLSTTGRDPVTSWSLGEVVAALAEEPTVVIGALEEPGCQLLGSIRDVIVDERGRIFVLDALHHTVRVFDSRGECLFEVGREGAGPGEFRRPESLEVLGSNPLLVLDPGNGRIEEFDVGGIGAHRVRSLSIAVPSTALCSIDGRLYISTRSLETILHHIDPDGGILRSFGAFYDDPRYTMSAMAGPERLLCHGRSRSLIVAPRHSARLHRYDEDGGLLFSGTIPGFAAGEFIEQDGRVVGYRPGPDGIEQPATLVELADGDVLIQSGLPSDLATQMFRRVKSYRKQVDAGTIHQLDVALPHVFAVRDSLLVAAHHGEVPRIGIWIRREDQH